jgi:hypothetical protein
MKATELRIGNLVKIAGSNYEIEVLNVTGSIFLSSMGAQDIKKVTPIPLTEEWLLKFGFEKDNNFTWIGVGINIMQREGGFYIWLGADLLLTTVHQLQNLYHALTGNELTITK